MKPKLIFDESTTPFIFEALGITIGDDGFLYKDGELILDMFDNQPMTEAQLGGISKGGFFRGDLMSIMNLVENNL